MSAEPPEGLHGADLILWKRKQAELAAKAKAGKDHVGDDEWECTKCGYKKNKKAPKEGVKERCVSCGKTSDRFEHWEEEQKRHKDEESKAKHDAALAAARERAAQREAEDEVDKRIENGWKAEKACDEFQARHKQFDKVTCKVCGHARGKHKTSAIVGGLAAGGEEGEPSEAPTENSSSGRILNEKITY
eukprot:g56249.t1